MVLPERVQVLVVGLGPVGATLANLLGGYGVRTLAVDREVGIYLAPRAIALDNEALRVLQLAGVREGEVDTVEIPVVRMHSPYFGEFARIESAGRVDGHPKLVTFHQPQLERVLRDRIARLPEVSVGLGATLTALRQAPGGIDAVLCMRDGGRATVGARFVVGADGAGSIVRRLAGLEVTGKTYTEDWLIVDARRAPTPMDHVEFLCNPGRPTPHMVAPGGRQRWEFMLQPGETREQMERPETVRALLAPWGDPALMEIERTAVYRFQAKVAERFRAGRLLLAGDAAHVTPPFIGQGLVAGLRDAANLAWKLAWVLHGRAAPNILDSYDAERRPHARAMVSLAVLMGQVVMPRSAGAAVLAHGFVRMIRLVPPLRALIDEQKIKPRQCYAHGLYVRGARPSRLRRGEPLGQVRVRSATGNLGLSDDALGPGFALVGFGEDPVPHLDAAAETALRAAGGRTVTLGRRDSGCAFEDLDAALVGSKAPEGWVAFVRPDRIVLHDGPVAQSARIVRESLALLGGAAPTTTSNHSAAGRTFASRTA
jgi:3-(3-hydroxy-phenyl)propionate hydroxylase